MPSKKPSAKVSLYTARAAKICIWIFAVLTLAGSFLFIFQPKSARYWVYEKWIEYQLNTELTKLGYQPHWESRSMTALSPTDHTFLSHHFLGYRVNPREWPTGSEEVVYFLKTEDTIFILTGPEVTTEKLILPDPNGPKANTLRVDIFLRASIPEASQIFPFIQPKEFNQLVEDIRRALTIAGRISIGSILLVYCAIPFLITRFEQEKRKRESDARTKARQERRLATHKEREAARLRLSGASLKTEHRVVSTPNPEEQLRLLATEIQGHATSENPEVQIMIQDALMKIAKTSPNRGLRIATHTLDDIRKLQSVHVHQEPKEYTESTPREYRKVTSHQQPSFAELLQEINQFVPPGVSCRAVQDTLLILCPPSRKKKLIGKRYTPLEHLKNGVVVAKHNKPSEFDGAFKWLTGKGVIQHPRSHPNREGGGGAGVWSLNIHPETVPTQEGRKIIAIIARALAQKDRSG